MGRHIWTHLGDVVHVPGGSGSGHGHGGGGGDGILTVILAIAVIVAIIGGIYWMFSSWENIVTVLVICWIIKKAAG